jgi:antitoxin VapB
MSVNIKNERVERLLDEVAALTGESKTEAVRRALEDRRDRLIRHPSEASRGFRMRRVLEREIWPMVPPEVTGNQLTRDEEDDILGFGPDGV